MRLSGRNGCNNTEQTSPPPQDAVDDHLQNPHKHSSAKSSGFDDASGRPGHGLSPPVASSQAPQRYCLCFTRTKLPPLM